jgi:hypothetical protein
MMRILSREQRERKRGSVAVPVKYTDLSQTADEKEKVTEEGTTTDLSSEGLGLFSYKELEPGDIVEIECKDLWEMPRKFTVKWCNRLQHNFFRLGLAAGEKAEESAVHP